jgi:long-chain acyl-CoA synthetase
MAETCGMCSVLPPELLQYGCVGLPSPSIEIKFRDVPEAGYLSANINNDETIFTKDDWLRTGYIGQ